MLKVVKIKSKTPIKTKDKKEVYPMRYFIVTDNNNYILIKPVFNTDYARLDMVAEYVKK